MFYSFNTVKIKLNNYLLESNGYVINFGSNGMSGRVLQYFTRQTSSVLLSPGAAAEAACWRRRSLSAFCGGLIVGGIRAILF